jgi:hypothetical protein
MSKPNLYLSFNVETDGCSVLLNNMISIGFYGLDNFLNKVFEFDANIENIPNHEPELACMENFWNKPEQLSAWNHLQQNKRNYKDVFKELSEHFKKLNNIYKLVFVAYPSCFDWQFFKNYWELARSQDSDMFDIGYSCQCSSTLWNSYKEKLNLSSNDANVLYLELSEFDKQFEHFASYDAKFQGIMYVKVKKLINQ